MKPQPLPHQSRKTRAKKKRKNKIKQQKENKKHQQAAKKTTSKQKAKQTKQHKQGKQEKEKELTEKNKEKKKWGVGGGPQQKTAVVAYTCNCPCIAHTCMYMRITTRTIKETLWKTRVRNISTFAKSSLASKCFGSKHVQGCAYSTHAYHHKTKENTDCVMTTATCLNRARYILTVQHACQAKLLFNSPPRPRPQLWS